MGSFYTTCSITGKTICDNQELYVQFLLPSSYVRDEPSIGETFKDSFLNVVKTKGLDEAIKSFDEATKTWGKGKELSAKGMKVSNDGASSKWVPFGPAIRGYYDDCGWVVPLTDEDSMNRVQILENLMGLPFKSILEVARDDRWFTYGMEEDSQHWGVEGVNKEMDEWQLVLCQKLSLTYFHKCVYDEMSKFDFDCESRDGVMDNKYSTDWKQKYVDESLKKLQKSISAFKKGLDKGKKASDILNDSYELRDSMLNGGIFRYLNRKLGLIYATCLVRENPSLDWYSESLNFMYAMSGMCLVLDRSQYGSQHQNWFGWERINKVLSPTLEKALTEYGYYDEEEGE